MTLAGVECTNICSIKPKYYHFLFVFNMGKKAIIIYILISTSLLTLAVISDFSYRADAKLGQGADPQTDSLYEKCLEISSQAADFPKEQLCSDVVNGTNFLFLSPQEKQSLRCDLAERASMATNETMPECMPSPN